MQRPAVLAALKHGLKLAGGDEPFRITKAQLDDLPFALGVIRPAIDAALFWALTGKTPEEMQSALDAIGGRFVEDDDTATLDGKEGENGEADRPFPDSEELSTLSG